MISEDNNDIPERLLESIRHLQSENRLLEVKINDAEEQNTQLQTQVDGMLRRMMTLENLLITLNTLSDQPNICSKCKCNRQMLEERTEGFLLSEQQEKTGDERLEFVTNPLLIDLIVVNTFKYLSPENLFSCRLVNRLWNEEASLILRKKYMFTVNNRYKIEKLNHFVQLHKQNSAANRIIGIESHWKSDLSNEDKDEEDLIMDSYNNHLTHNKYELLYSKIKFDLGFVIQQFRPQLDSFFENFGSYMKSLSIHCDEEHGTRIYMEEVRNLFLNNVPNLEYLQLSLPTKITEKEFIYPPEELDIMPIFQHLKSISLIQTDNVGGYSIGFMKQLLKMAPNLVRLHVETHNAELMWRILIAMTSLELQNKNISNNLRELLLDAYITENHLRILSEFSFHLEKLQLTYFTLDAQKDTLENFLSKHKSSLKELSIGDYQKRSTIVSPPLLIRFPVLENLTSLRILDPYFPAQRQLLISPPLKYAEQLPKLKRLCFDHEEEKPSGIHLFTDFFVDPARPCYTLEELEICKGLKDPALVGSINKMFPKLKRLILRNAPDDVIKAVWTHLLDIKELTLSLSVDNHSVDSLMTGIPDEVCQRIQEGKMFSKVELGVLEIIRTDVSICNLTELQTLKIDGCPSSLMTAVTGYLALCYMKNLTNISIKADVATISRACRNAMTEKLHLACLEIL